MRLVDAPARQYASAMHTNQHPAAIEFWRWRAQRILALSRFNS